MQRTHHVSRLLLLASVLLGAPLRSSVAREEMTDTKVEIAAERAHFAQDFCGDSADQTAAFKERIRKALPDAQDFDARWQLGWQREDRAASALRSQRLSDPADYAQRVKGSCGRLRWQAENSLRTAPKN